MANNLQKTLRILALGDSLTAGYYEGGHSFHPYGNKLQKLFDLANIPARIDVEGVSGERVVPTMTKRLSTILANDTSYDWIVLLGGTNDLAGSSSAKRIFKEGLEPMYDMCLKHRESTTKLVAMTVIENGFYPPKHREDREREKLNGMIREYVSIAPDKSRIRLVDLDNAIPYHNLQSNNERRMIWDDLIHLTPTGYDRVGELIFEAIKDKL